MIRAQNRWKPCQEQNSAIFTILSTEEPNFGRNSLPETEGFNPEKIDPETRDLIDEVYDVFGKYMGTVLTNLTHQEKPWMSTEKNSVIGHDVMRDYFKSQLVVG